MVNSTFSLSSELISFNSMVSTIQSKATIANKSCLSSKPNSSLYFLSLSLINLPARLILASSSTFTFMGYSLSPIFIFIESVSISPRQVVNYLINFLYIIGNSFLQFSRRFIFYRYVVYNFTNFNLIFKMFQGLLFLFGKILGVCQLLFQCSIFLRYQLEFSCYLTRKPLQSMKFVVNHSLFSDQSSHLIFKRLHQSAHGFIDDFICQCFFNILKVKT